jgi:hypothetical protein
MSDQVQKQLVQALERILNKKTIHLKKGASLTAANVIRETGRSPDKIKLARYPSIQATIAEEKAKIAKQRKIANEKSSRTRRTLESRFDDAKKERDKLASIVAAQNEYVLDLLDEIQRLNGSVVNIKK